MYKLNRFFCSVFCLLLVFSTSSFAEKLSLACSSWYPFSGKELENQGFYNQIVKKAGAAVGLDIDIQIMSWNRAIVLTKQGKLDGISCLNYQRQRESWLAFTKNSFLVSEIGLFARKDSQMQGVMLNDLKGKRIGVLADVYYFKSLTDYSKGQFVIRKFFDEDSALKILHGRRYDAVYLLHLAGKALLRHKFPEIADDIEYLGTLDEALVHAAISLKHPKAKEIARKLDAGYQIIKESGQLAKILDGVLYTIVKS